MEVVLTRLAASALDTAKRSERLRLLEEAVDLCKEDHGEALANEPGTQFHSFSIMYGWETTQVLSLSIILFFYSMNLQYQIVPPFMRHDA